MTVGAPAFTHAECADPRELLTELGELVELRVRGRRRPLTFRAPPPILAYDRNGLLVIAYPTASSPPRRVPPDELAKAERAYRISHWGARGGRDVRVGACADPRKPLIALGSLGKVVYRTSKAGDAPNSEYEHAFSAPYPVLAYSSDGLLVVAGGNYRMTWRGIRG